MAGHMKNKRAQSAANVPGSGSGIDALKHAVMQLEWYRFMVSSSEDRMSFIDRDGVYRMANQAFLSFLGLDESGVIGHHYSDVLSRDQNAPLEARLEKTLSGQRVREEELHVVDGVESHRLITMHPCYDETDQLLGTCVIDQDITEIKEKERHLETANARLKETLEDLKSKERQIIHQERLSALGEMAGGIAHDFNNALQPVLLAAGMLAEDEELRGDPDAVREYVDGILQSARAAAETVRRLVRFYRPAEQASMTPIDLSTLVQDTISLTKPKWREESQSRGITVSILTDLEENVRVEGYHAELRELVVNLLFNAVEAMEESGTVQIRTSRQEGRATLEIEDSGKGMTEYERSRCLEPFYTTKIQRGHGLGLSIVHSIVKRHFGELAVESEVGRGTRFRVAFPAPMSVIVEDEEAGPTESRATEVLHARILLVDDEKMLLDLLTHTLERKGATVFAAESGHTALRIAEEEPIDLLITDQAMPGMSGMELAEILHQRNPDLPVIMLTGFGEFMKKQGGLSGEIDLLLSKPVSINDLTEAIHSLRPEPVLRPAAE
jgi:PAS domain S-box-containing protein